MTRYGFLLLLLGNICKAQTGILDPTQFPGTDIALQINNAAASCTANSQCWISLPPGTKLIFSHTITFINNETVECPRSGAVDNTTGGDSTTKLSYTGSGVAVQMNNKAGRFVGCDLLLGGSAAAGVVMGGYSNHADDIGVRGGGTGTDLIHISGTAAEDNHFENSRLSDFVGTGIAIDHSNDTFLTNITAYGKLNNSTSTTLLLDSGAGGVTITNLIGGDSGLHGFWERYTLGGNYPTFLFANN